MSNTFYYICTHTHNKQRQQQPQPARDFLIMAMFDVRHFKTDANTTEVQYSTGLCLASKIDYPGRKFTFSIGSDKLKCFHDTQYTHFPWLSCYTLFFLSHSSFLLDFVRFLTISHRISKRCKRREQNAKSMKMFPASQLV